MLPILNFSKVSGRVYGGGWKCPFMALWKIDLINVAENQNSPITFGKNLPYRI
jgi:hypothetical protein